TLGDAKRSRPTRQPPARGWAFHARCRLQLRRADDRSPQPNAIEGHDLLQDRPTADRSPGPAMLLCLSSRQWRSVFEEAVEAAGEVALEAAVCLAARLALL